MNFLEELNASEDRVEQAMREALETEIPGSMPQGKPAIADQLYIVYIGGYKFWFRYNLPAAISNFHILPPYGSC